MREAMDFPILKIPDKSWDSFGPLISTFSQQTDKFVGICEVRIICTLETLRAAQFGRLLV